MGAAAAVRSCLKRTDHARISGNLFATVMALLHWEKNLGMKSRREPWDVVPAVRFASITKGLVAALVWTGDTRRALEGLGESQSETPVSRRNRGFRDGKVK